MQEASRGSAASASEPMVVKATKGGPAADTLPRQKDGGPSEPVVDAKGGTKVLPSLAFRLCMGCGHMYWGINDLGCDVCQARAVVVSTCDIVYCIDCGAVMRKGQRCRPCRNLYDYQTRIVPRLVDYVERIERDGWNQSNELSLIASERRRGRATKYKAHPVENPCHVPGCGRERLYASGLCNRHDTTLNGPLLIAWGGKKGAPLSATRCMTCLIPFVSKGHFRCPYHDVDAVCRIPFLRNIYGGVSVECPVDFVRLKGDDETKAWWAYAEHHRRKHPMVALVHE